MITLNDWNWFLKTGTCKVYVCGYLIEQMNQKVVEDDYIEIELYEPINTTTGEFKIGKDIIKLGRFGGIHPKLKELRDGKN
jgi:hypothetical protein